MVTKSDLGTYVYPAATAARPHTPLTVGTETFTYDNNGNMLTGLNGKVMTYDGENRPLDVTLDGQLDHLDSDYFFMRTFTLSGARR